jgi:Family of unknown function (DUF5681)
MPFVKGQSGNPRGRPRAGLALAERIRERLDPDIVIDLALRLAADESIELDKRLAALLQLADRGFIKPPLTMAAQITTTNDAPRDLSTIPLEVRRAMLAALRDAPRLAEPSDT